MEVCRWNSVGEISNVAGGNLEGRWWVLHDGIGNVTGGVLQVGFLKMGIWKFAGGILLVRFLMWQVGIWKVAGGFCMME